MARTRILKWQTQRLLRVFKVLDREVPRAARPYIADFFARWRTQFGRAQLLLMLHEWTRMNALIASWRCLKGADHEDEDK